MDLPKRNIVPQDPNKTYNSVMNQRKKKSWGLHTRVNYEHDNGSNMFAGNNKDESKIFKIT